MFLQNQHLQGGICPGDPTFVCFFARTFDQHIAAQPVTNALEFLKSYIDPEMSSTNQP